MIYALIYFAIGFLSTGIASALTKDSDFGYLTLFFWPAILLMILGNGIGLCIKGLFNL